MQHGKGTQLRGASSAFAGSRLLTEHARPIERPEPESMRYPCDQDLSERLAEDDSSALEELISRYWDRLITYAARILDDQLGAEDVVQEAYVRLWNRRHSLESGAAVPFLFRVIRNLAVDEVRSRNARSKREGVTARNGHQSPSTPAEVMRRDGLAAEVNAALRSLPERRREAFTLAYLGGLSYHELAGVMGISEKTVGHHISAALAELRKELRPLLDELP